MSERPVLGVGSYGTVYGVTSKRCEKKFETFLPDSLFLQMAFFQWLQEMKINSVIGLVLPSDLQLLDKRFVLGMPRYVCSLYTWVAEKGPIQDGLFYRLYHETRAALLFLNNTVKIMLGDISPSNILMNKDGQGHFADFDLVRHLSWSNITFGTDAYYVLNVRPPELLLGVTNFSDLAACALEVWALGMTLDYANRGTFLFSPAIPYTEQTLVEAQVKMFGPVVADSVLRHSPRWVPSLDERLRPVLRKYPPQFIFYQPMLQLEPKAREILTAATCSPIKCTINSGIVTCRSLKTLLYRLSQPIPKELQQTRHGLVEQLLQALHELPDLDAFAGVNSILLLDLYIYTFTSIPSNIIDGVVYLIQAQLFNNGTLREMTLQKVTEPTESDFLNTVLQLAQACQWMPILGFERIPTSWEMVLELALYPAKGYRAICLLYKQATELNV